MNFLPLPLNSSYNRIVADYEGLDPDAEFVPDLGAGIPATGAGSFLNGFGRSSRLLNTKFRVQAISKDSTTAEKIVYEAKRIGVEVVGITQEAGKIIIELAAASVALYCLVAIVGHGADFFNRGKKVTKELAEDVLKKENPGMFRKALQWSWGNKGKLALGAGALALGKYGYDRYKSYQEPKSDVQRISYRTPY